MQVKRQLTKGKEEEAIRDKKRIEHEALVKEYQAYKKLGRNDICLCGSGKKYKKMLHNQICNNLKTNIL